MFAGPPRRSDVGSFLREFLPSVELVELDLLRDRSHDLSNAELWDRVFFLVQRREPRSSLHRLAIPFPVQSIGNLDLHPSGVGPGSVVFHGSVINFLLRCGKPGIHAATRVSPGSSEMHHSPENSNSSDKVEPRVDPPKAHVSSASIMETPFPSCVDPFKARVSSASMVETPFPSKPRVAPPETRVSSTTMV